jgi:beta-glucosidase
VDVTSDAISDVTFPGGFLFGTATAAHQIEGGNVNSDWWRWEHDPASPCEEPSGDACDSYHRWPNDLDIVAELGLDVYRFSVEWARIEPEPGEFSRAQLEHYARIVAGCRDRGIVPMVTLQHFTLPRWLADRGHFAAPEFADRFAAYVRVVVEAVGEGVGWWCTLNELSLPPTLGFLAGGFPPGREEDEEGLAAALDQVEEAHRRAVDSIRERSDAPAGMTLALFDVQPVDGLGDPSEARTRFPLGRFDERFLEVAADDDFVGVQTYTRVRVGPDGALPPEEGAETTLMGYEFRPEALEATIRFAWERSGGTPIFVTENGIAAEDDRDRIRFVRRALAGVASCLDDGIDVRGYLYWSLLDNFEWTYGYGPTFGLVSVDREDFARTVKPSARWFGQVAAARAVVDP